MIIILSPSKTQDFTTHPYHNNTTPRLLAHSQLLIDQLKTLSANDISKLMSLSAKLSSLNVERYRAFHTPFTRDNAKQALLAFKGDVYRGFALAEYSDEDFSFAQQHLRILSGLYGLLRPLDLIQAYRLEMGTKLSNVRGKNLYQFWGDRLSALINEEETELVVNLASNEYTKAINKKALNARMITIDFKERRNGKYQTIGLLAKRARGLMANFIIQNRITDQQDLPAFVLDNYRINEQLSTEATMVFSRG